jgi:hypothetical protein
MHSSPTLASGKVPQGGLEQLDSLMAHALERPVPICSHSVSAGGMSVMNGVYSARTHLSWMAGKAAGGCRPHARMTAPSPRHRREGRPAALQRRSPCRPAAGAAGIACPKQAVEQPRLKACQHAPIHCKSGWPLYGLEQSMLMLSPAISVYTAALLAVQATHRELTSQRVWPCDRDCDGCQRDGGGRVERAAWCQLTSGHRLWQCGICDQGAPDLQHAHRNSYRWDHA